MESKKKVGKNVAGPGNCRCKNRKAQIIEMSRDIIFSEGFANFTVRRVATGVGISEAAIYRHFASKEELMLALLDFLFCPWRREIDELIKKKVPAVEKLIGLVELHLNHLLQKQLNPMLFFSEAVHPDNKRLIEKLRGNIQFLHESIEKIICSAVKSLEFRNNLAVDSAIAVVTGVLQTNVVRWTLMRNDYGLKEKASGDMKFVVSMFLNERRKEK